MIVINPEFDTDNKLAGDSESQRSFTLPCRNCEQGVLFNIKSDVIDPLSKNPVEEVKAAVLQHLAERGAYVYCTPCVKILRAKPEGKA